MLNARTENCEPCVAIHLLCMEIDVDPTAEVASNLDYYGNTVWMIAVETPHRELVIDFKSDAGSDCVRTGRG